MVLTTASDRVVTNLKMVFELLAANMPAQDQSPDPEAHFWQQADVADPNDVWFSSGRAADQSGIPVGSVFQDASHPSIAVNLACISRGLCERACRDVQVNDVIGIGGRGMGLLPVFDLE